MTQVTIEFVKLDPRAVIPQYMTRLAAGMDICALVDQPLTLNPGQRILVPTGLACAVPPGYEVQVRPRSGLAINQGIALVNSPGTIDADYRGEIRIILINLGQQPFIVHSGDRIAQLVVAPVLQVEVREVMELSETERGKGGFGHTG